MAPGCNLKTDTARLPISERSLRSWCSAYLALKKIVYDERVRTCHSWLSSSMSRSTSSGEEAMYGQRSIRRLARKSTVVRVFIFFDCTSLQQIGNNHMQYIGAFGRKLNLFDRKLSTRVYCSVGLCFFPLSTINEAVWNPCSVSDGFLHLLLHSLMCVDVVLRNWLLLGPALNVV